MGKTSISYQNTWNFVNMNYIIILQEASLSKRCSYDRNIRYTAVLENNTGHAVDMKVISSDSCIDSLCFTSFSTFRSSAIEKIYHVTVHVTNIFGASGS